MEPNLFHTRYLCIGLFQTLREKETMAFSYIFVKFWIVWNNKNSFFYVWTHETYGFMTILDFFLILFNAFYL